MSNDKLNVYVYRANENMYLIATDIMHPEQLRFSYFLLILREKQWVISEIYNVMDFCIDCLASNNISLEKTDERQLKCLDFSNAMICENSFCECSQYVKMPSYNDVNQLRKLLKRLERC